MNHVLRFKIDLMLAKFIRDNPPADGGRDWASIAVSFIRTAIHALCNLPDDLHGDELILWYTRELVARVVITQD